MRIGLWKRASPAAAFVGVAALMLAVLVAVRSGAAPADRKHPAKVAAGTKTPPAVCKKDADCVLVTDGCCSCTEAGKRRAFPKSQQAAYEADRAKKCAGAMCPQMMSQDPSCSARAICRAGACALSGAPAQPTP